MLLAEKKTRPDEIEEELVAFNPLVPRENELTFTLMFEIDNKTKREQVLSSLANVEEHVHLHLGKDTITSVPIDGEEGYSRVDRHGKTSAVHFRKFVLKNAEVLKAPASVSISHPNYGHTAIFGDGLLSELKKDLY